MGSFSTCNKGSVRKRKTKRRNRELVMTEMSSGKTNNNMGLIVAWGGANIFKDHDQGSIVSSKLEHLQGYSNWAFTSPLGPVPVLHHHEENFSVSDANFPSRSLWLLLLVLFAMPR